MKSDTKIWLTYSEENLESAKILLQSSLFNPCLQNIQQSVEKALKAIYIEHSIKFQRTHDIYELVKHLKNEKIIIDISDDECDFLNSIYLPSKYPLGSVLADYDPDKSICEEAMGIADNVFKSVNSILS